PYWTTASLDLGPFDGVPQLFIRWRFKSNDQVNAAGFFIDGITLSATSDQEAYQFMSGTSMAAGFVSGAAAGLLSQNGALTPMDLKSILMQSVDANDHFSGKIASGGRINAYSAMMLQDDPNYRSPSASSGGPGSGGGGGCFIEALAE
ncbi:MAG: S8 family serine peptidase, partial [Desulfobacteraceae bacterium]|nr:S8 family serine peptidase [Desulfobacteraceae bacterium]